MGREEVIREYFQAWVDNDIGVLGRIFSDDIIYSESYGPEYHGMSQIMRWFADWNRHGRVLEWSIKRFVHQGSVSVVEWHFECELDGRTDGFDGVSIVEFDEDSKIIDLREFQSKAEHSCPYGGDRFRS